VTDRDEPVSKGAKPAGSYPRKVQEDTRRLVDELVGENERMHALIAALRSEKLLQEEELLSAREALDRQKREQLRLQRELAEFESKTKHFTQQYAEIEQQSSNLTNLYVASYQLHGTLDRRVVLDTIQEIIANLVGSEEVAIFELEPDGKGLSLSAALGIEMDQLGRVTVGEGLIGRVAQTGETYIAGEASSEHALPQEARLTACLPLKLEDRVTGVIALFRLLPQKSGIADLDRELFDLLAVHAAMALYCTRLHARLGTVTPR